MARNTTWKANETNIARMFGYIGRNSLSGNNSKSGSCSDNHPKRAKGLPKGNIYIECKRRKNNGTTNLYLAELPKARKEKKILVLALMTKSKMLIVLDPRDLPDVAREYREGCTIRWKSPGGTKSKVGSVWRLSP